MSLTTDRSVASVAAQLQRAISKAMPFSRSESRTFYLLSPFADIEVDKQRDALAHLVSLGVLTEYRYIDAQPHPAILVVSA